MSLTVLGCMSKEQMGFDKELGEGNTHMHTCTHMETVIANTR
jgi:hypothetical protein